MNSTDLLSNYVLVGPRSTVTLVLYLVFHSFYSVSSVKEVICPPRILVK